MSKAEQVALGTTLAGVNQYKVFSAVMTNFDTAIKATNDSLMSQGSAAKENAKYMESLKARLQTLKAELQKFILSGNVLQNIFKGLVTGLTNIIKFFNTTTGKFILLDSAILLLVSNFGKLINTIKIFINTLPEGALKTFIGLITTTTKIIKAYSKGQMTATTATLAFKSALESLELNPYLLVLTAILAMISAAVIASKKLNEAVEEHKEKLKETSDAIEESKNNLEQYEKNLKEIIKQIDALNKSDFDIDKNYEENINKLQREKEELEEIIRLEKIKQQQEKEDARKEAAKVFKDSPIKNVWNVNSEQGKKQQYYRPNENLAESGYVSQDFYDFWKTRNAVNPNYAQSLTSATAYMKYYADEYDRLLKIKNSGGVWTEEDDKALKSAKENLDGASKAANEAAITLKETMDSTDNQAEGYKEASEAYESYQEALSSSSEDVQNIIGLNEELDEELESEAEAYEKLQENIENLAGNLGMSAGQLERLRDTFKDDEALENFLNVLYGIKIKLDEASSAIDGVQDAFSKAKQANEEFNQNGYLTLDTFQSLLGVSAEYLACLVDEDGQLRMNSSALEELVGKMKEAKIQEIQNAAATDIYNYIMGDTENMSSLAKTAVDGLKTAVEQEGNAAVISGKQNMDFAAGVMTILASMGASDQQLEENMSNVNKIANAWKGVADAVNGIGISVDDLTNKTKESAGSAKSAIDEVTQALENQKKQYETVIAYIKKKIQDEINKIREAKQAEVDAIKERIEALKNLKDAEIDSIEEQIDKLEEQRDIEKEYWEEKIDAFKKQNEELEEQLEYEELLENLAKAKSKRVRVYKEGQGFVYTEDGNEVDKAQSKIDEYTRKKQYKDQLELLQSYKEKSEKYYKEQIESLEKLKKEKEKNYEEQIKALEEYQKQVEAGYDAQIAYFQEYLDKFTEQTDAYENETNRQLAIQLTGIDFEQQGWQKRLDNLSNFVTEYNNLLSQLGSGEVTTTATTTTTTTTTGNKGNTTGDKGKTTGDKGNTTGNNVDLSKYIQPKQTTISNENLKKAVASGMPSSALASATGQNIKAVTGLEKGAKKDVGLWDAKASGDSSISEDGMYLVGDSPNQELVIGSKLNGSLMSLSEGSGVVNATSTRTLAGVLNQLGLAGNQGINMSNSQNKSTNIQIGNISLPSVQNGKDFVDYLQNFSLQMTQEAFA